MSFKFLFFINDYARKAGLGIRVHKILIISLLGLGGVSLANTLSSESARLGINPARAVLPTVVENPFVPPYVQADLKSMLPQLHQVGQQRKLRVVFLLDNSGSMEHNDPENHRFSSVKKLFKDGRVLRHVKKAALIVFSDEAEILLPFTSARGFAAKFDEVLLGTPNNRLLGGVQVSKGKTDLNAPFQALDRLLATEKTHEPLAVILLSDGVPTYQYQNSHLFLKEQGIPIFTIGYNRFSSAGAGSGPAGKQADFNEAFLRTLSEANQGKFLSASATSIHATYREMVQTISHELSPLSVTKFKKRYAPNELMVFTYDLKEAATQVKSELNIASCHVRARARRSSAAPEAEALASKDLVANTVSELHTLKLFKETKISTTREKLYFYPLALGHYKITLKMNCSGVVEYQKDFKVMFSEREQAVQINNSLHLIQREQVPYVKNNYFNLQALTDLSIWGWAYVPDSGKAASPVFAINFSESKTHLKAGEQKLQSYQIVRLHGADNEGEVTSSAAAYKTGVRTGVFETGHLEVITSKGHYLFQVFLEDRSTQQVLHPVWNYNTPVSPTRAMQPQQPPRKKTPHHNLSNALNIPVQPILPKGHQANRTTHQLSYKAASWANKVQDLSSSSFHVEDSSHVETVKSAKIWEWVSYSFLGGIWLVLSYFMGVGIFKSLRPVRQVRTRRTF